MRKFTKEKQVAVDYHASKVKDMTDDEKLKFVLDVANKYGFNLDESRYIHNVIYIDTPWKDYCNALTWELVNDKRRQISYDDAKELMTVAMMAPNDESGHWLADEILIEYIMSIDALSIKLIHMYDAIDKWH